MPRVLSRKLIILRIYQVIALYIFIDESGNWDFSSSSSRYLIFGGLSLYDPSKLTEKLLDLKRKLNYEGRDIQRFHASEDRQAVRDQVFRVLSKCQFETDFVIIEKYKTNPTLQNMTKLYPKMAMILLEYIFQRYKWRAADPGEIDKIVIFTDTIQRKKRRAIEKALKKEVKQVLGQINFNIYHHSSYSHFGLQAVDYCTWAIFRKWERNDYRSYDLISEKVESEFDIFERGKTKYY